MEKRPVAAEDLLRLRFAADPRISPDGRWIAYSLTQIEPENRTYKTELWLTAAAGGQNYRVTKEGARPAWSPDGRRLAFVSDRSGTKQIWVLADGFGEAEQLTTMRYGASEPAWSPDGREVLFLSPTAPEDNADTLRREMSKEEKEKESKERQDRPYAAERLHYKQDDAGLVPPRTAQLWVIDVVTKDIRQLTDGDGDIKAPAWSPDGRYVAFVSNRLADPDRYPTVADLYVVPAAGGEPVRLTRSDGAAQQPAWSPDGREIAYLWNDLSYKLATLPKLCTICPDGTAGRCLTPQPDLGLAVTANSDSRYGVGPAAPVWTADGHIYVLASAAGETNIYRIPAAGGEFTAVTHFNGAIYAFSLDRAGRQGAAAAGDPLSPGEIFSLNLPDGAVGRRTEINTVFLAGLELSRPEAFDSRSQDGRRIQGWMLPPIGCRPGQQYPAILEIHGGPHTMFGEAFFFEFQLLASLGYAVLYANPRGSHGYGQEFVRACCGDYGGMDYADLMAVTAEAIRRYPLIDPARLGVTGGSYGGFMTNWIVTRTNRFRAAVTQRSICNWASFTGSSDIGFFFTEEELGGTPWTDPALLAQFSPISYVQNITTPLLIIHSEQDLRCPIEQAEQLYVALRRLDKTVRFLRFPGSSHELSRSGKPALRVERLKAIAEWFGRYLG